MHHHEMLWLWFTETDIADLSPCDWAATDAFASRQVCVLCCVVSVVSHFCSDQHGWRSIYVKVQHWAHLKIQHGASIPAD